MKASLFYTVMLTITAGLAYAIWEYRHSTIPVPDLEALRFIPVPHGTSGLRPFYIDKYEVTNGKYWRFNSHHRFTPGEEDFPVVNVTWYEAMAYAQWAGKRLPTVREWEYARSARTNEFSAWDVLEPKALVLDKDQLRLFRVGKYWRDRTPLGVLDMSGNAWEWTADTLRLADSTLAAIVKGGFIFRGDSLIYSQPAQSDTLPVNTRSKWVGFRCIRYK